MSTRLRSLVARSLALAILAILTNAAPLAGAEIHVAGAAGAVQLEVNDATVDEALTALGALGLRYRTAVALNRRITGTYEGPLARIVSRLLQDYNFIVQTSSDGVQATVLDNSSATTAVPGAMIPGVGRPGPAAVQQNQGGPRGIDMTQPPQGKPPAVLGNSSGTAVPGLPVPGVGRPAPAAAQQNQGGQRRIDMTQPPQDRPAALLGNSPATAVPGLPIPGVGRPAPATIR